jgi:hypothetical protein
LTYAPIRAVIMARIATATRFTLGEAGNQKPCLASISGSVLQMGTPDLSTWTDHLGQTWKTPPAKYRINFNYKYHKALREFIHFRDKSCLRCGATMSLEIDHIKPWRTGAGNHPSNLQLLCQSCNLKKEHEYNVQNY